MNVIVDGKAFQAQGQGGISRLFREILPRMCDLDKRLSVTLLTSGRCRATLPVHPRIRRRSLFPIDDLLRPHRIWRPILDPARGVIQRAGLAGRGGDVWHSTYYTSLNSWRGPAVVTVFDMIHERFPAFFDEGHDRRFRLEKERCVRAADAVVCISDTTKRDLLDLYRIDDSKVRVIPLAASPVFEKLARAGEALPGLADRPFVIYVGDRSPYKNFPEVVRAYGSWSRRDDIDLVVVGPAWSREERDLLASLRVAGRVRRLSGVDDRTLCRLYNKAMALIHPSLYEGFGIPLLEAMACGCPIIASRIPTTLEIAGDQPVYYEAGRPDGLVSALDAVRREGRDPERTRAGLAIAGKYSWTETARLTLSVYRELI